MNKHNKTNNNKLSNIDSRIEAEAAASEAAAAKEYETPMSHSKASRSGKP